MLVLLEGYISGRYWRRLENQGQMIQTQSNDVRYRGYQTEPHTNFITELDR